MYKIKYTCARCGGAFKNTRAHYNQHGNYCTDCTKSISPAYKYAKYTSGKNFMWMSEDEIANDV